MGREGGRKGGREGGSSSYLSDSTGLHGGKCFLQRRDHGCLAQDETKIFFVGSIKGAPLCLALGFVWPAVVAAGGREGRREGGREGGREGMGVTCEIGTEGMSVTLPVSILFPSLPPSLPPSLSPYPMVYPSQSITTLSPTVGELPLPSLTSLYCRPEGVWTKSGYLVRALP